MCLGKSFMFYIVLYDKLQIQYCIQKLILFFKIFCLKLVTYQVYLKFILDCMVYKSLMIGSSHNMRCGGAEADKFIGGMY
ncbi:hypothetical protein DFO74_10916 [Chromohalobacter israelensis]|nr:hypothetical protein DFO74_10916 [Chromohalobacter salexigens]